MSSFPPSNAARDSDEDDSVDDNVTLKSLLTIPENKSSKVLIPSSVSVSSSKEMVTRSHTNKRLLNNDNERNVAERDDASDSIKPKATRKTLATTMEDKDELPAKKRKENGFLKGMN